MSETDFTGRMALAERIMEEDRTILLSLAHETGTGWGERGRNEEERGADDPD